MKEKITVEFIVILSLQYLRQVWNFDDIEEAMGVSEEVHHGLFSLFVHYVSTLLYERYLNMLLIYK